MPRKTNSRNAQGAGSIHQRPDGRWEARYTTGRDPGTGKQVQRSVYGDTQSEVLKKLQQISVEAENGNLIEPSKMTVAQWLDVWQNEYLGSVKHRTVHSYKGTIKGYIIPALGAIKLQKLNPHNIQAFYNDLQRVKNLSPKTIKNTHGVFHAALKQAIHIGYIKTNPADGATLPRIEKPELTVLPEESISAFLAAIKDDIYAPIYYITLFTGMRQGEILGLSWDNIDFTNGTIYICRQLQRNHDNGSYLLAPIKNDKPRRISPAPAVMNSLRKVKVTQAESKLKAGAAWVNPDNLVFTNELGGNLIHKTVYAHFKKIADKINMPGLRFHDLRHSYAVNALQSGDDIKTVQDSLGHHTAAFTLDVYGFVTDKMRQDSAQRMEQFIKQFNA